MWIKSQDGDILINTTEVSHFYIPASGDSLMVRADNESVEIGVYGSEEECRAVLDRIIATICFGSTIYYMPKKGVVKI